MSTTGFVTGDSFEAMREGAEQSGPDAAPHASGGGAVAQPIARVVGRLTV
jgi:hypothetical protein